MLSRIRKIVANEGCSPCVSGDVQRPVTEMNGRPYSGLRSEAHVEGHRRIHTQHLYDGLRAVG